MNPPSTLIPFGRPQIIVPPRVHVAAQVLSMLNTKTHSPIVVTGGESSARAERMEGETLTPNEVLVHNAACDVLADYLTGKLNLDGWESAAFTQVAERAKRPPKTEKRVMTRLITCPNCSGAGCGCSLCGGEGSMVLMRPKDA